MRIWLQCSLGRQAQGNAPMQRVKAKESQTALKSCHSQVCSALCLPHSPNYGAEDEAFVIFCAVLECSEAGFGFMLGLLEFISSPYTVSAVHGDGGWTWLTSQSACIRVYSSMNPCQSAFAFCVNDANSLEPGYSLVQQAEITCGSLIGFTYCDVTKCQSDTYDLTEG